MLEIFALFASSKKTRKLQARELPGWAIPRIIGVLQYALTNAGAGWGKATSKGSGLLPAPHPGADQP